MGKIRPNMHEICMKLKKSGKELQKKKSAKNLDRQKNKDVRTSQSCDHVHLGTSAIQVNERDTGEQAKKKKLKKFKKFSKVRKTLFCCCVVVSLL